LFCSKQIKQPNKWLPINIVVFATTSQILAKSDGSCQKKKYEGDIPTNITAIKYFEKAKKKTLPIW
jgi:hypothetical protein